MDPAENRQAALITPICGITEVTDNKYVWVISPLVVSDKCEPEKWIGFSEQVVPVGIVMCGRPRFCKS
jgi:hypothetical protein